MKILELNDEKNWRNGLRVRLLNTCTVIIYCITLLWGISPFGASCMFKSVTICFVRWVTCFPLHDQIEISLSFWNQLWLNPRWDPCLHPKLLFSSQIFETYMPRCYCRLTSNVSWFRWRGQAKAKKVCMKLMEMVRRMSPLRTIQTRNCLKNPLNC